MGVKVELSFFDLLSKLESEESLKLALDEITNKIKPININHRFEVDFFSSHLFAIHLIFRNPNAGEALKIRCFKSLVDLNSRLRSIHQQIGELEMEVLRFEVEENTRKEKEAEEEKRVLEAHQKKHPLFGGIIPPTQKRVKRPIKTQTQIDMVRAYRSKAGRMHLMKVCVHNYKQALSAAESCLNMCAFYLPNTPEAELLKLLR